MNSHELAEQLRRGDLAERFLDLYIDANSPERQKERYLRAIAAFEAAYGEAEIFLFSAPGRTEVGGNHTDHQHGEVLAASIDRDAIGVVHPTADGVVSVISDGYDRITIDLSDLSRKPSEEGTTEALIRGVLAGVQEHGYAVGGFQAYITSDVLIGAGLSSSAAFETLIGTILSSLYNEDRIDPVEIAILGQYAENVYFGKPCGLMDQMACSVGSLVHIDFADPASPVVEQVEYDFASAGYRLCITDTKGSHADLTPDYAAVPAEMRQIAAYFHQEVLRDVGEEDVLRALPALRECCGDRAVLRALHFYEENKRVRREVAALRAGDISAFLAAVRASGASSFQYLQNVYTSHDVTHQNVSLALQLAELVLADGHGAARVHGGGFAGTMQAWVPEEQVAAYRTQMDAVFGAGACAVLNIRRYGGVRVC